MAKFVRKGNVYQVLSDLSLDARDRLPPGNFVLKFDPDNGFFLEIAEPFVPPSKLYGGIEGKAARIINTFLDRPASTGVLLSGEKGAGKTLMAKLLAHTGAARHDMPSVVINAPYHGPAFNAFIQSIQQDCIVLFDEFDKVYRDESVRDDILTLLDGVFPSRKLFVLTVNDMWRIGQFMQNRPGRIYYLLDYKGLTPEFVREYCTDQLLNQAHVDSVCRLSNMFSAFNFDMLAALVQEMNRYNEAPQQALEMLNVKAIFSEGAKYSLEIHELGKPVRKQRWAGTPARGMRVEYYDNDDEVTITMTPEHLKSIGPNGQQYVFEDSDGTRVVATKERSVIDDDAFYGLFAA